MQEEMESLQKNNTYELVKLPKGRKALRNKWVYKLKKDGRGDLVKYKARLVVKGFGQKKGIDFDEIFSPVVKLSSIRIILGLATNQDLEIEQLDVKTAFLHGDLEEEIYMQQPEGFEDEERRPSLQIKEKSVWVEAGSTTMVQEVRLIHGGSWVPKNCSRLLCLLQTISW